jgi:hypothetical protein
VIIPAGTVLAPLEPESDEKPPSTLTRREPRRPKTGDRFGEINAFVDLTLRALTRTEGFVWLVLWRDSRNGLSRTSYASLARTCGCRRATVALALRSLRGKGRGASVYRLRSVVESS